MAQGQRKWHVVPGNVFVRVINPAKMKEIPEVVQKVSHEEKSKAAAAEKALAYEPV